MTMFRSCGFRELTIQDERLVWTALYYALHVPPGAEPFPPDVVHDPSLARYAERWMQRTGDLGVVAESAGEPVGVAWLRQWTGADRGFGFVDEETPELAMAVWPGYRGRGIGTALLTRLLEAATPKHPAVSLSVSLTNPALRLYERFGFESNGDHHGDSMTMVKRLSPPVDPVAARRTTVQARGCKKTGRS